MSKQKRFSKDFEIQAEIIKQRRKLKTHLANAEKLEDERKAQLKMANKPDMKEHERAFYKDNAGELELKANKLRKRAFVIETKKLPALKEALAEFRTKPLPGFMGSDEGVVLHE